MPSYDMMAVASSVVAPVSAAARLGGSHQHDDDNNSTSAYSSSSGSAPDSSPQFNQLAFQMQMLELNEARRGGSDSGTSSVDHTIEHQTDSSVPAGPWYFEVAGAGEDGPLSAMKGTRNVTETVIVPSSEHVAEIVGRQGCKIKALRAKTNTYIKTPVRGEDPMFVVTGRPEDVDVAKAEIEAAADHFTQIRASRRHSQGGQPAPGHITAYVRVPYRVVGLVVGPKGGTIKRIQQETHTYIITPSREREPIFEVTGLPANVDNARAQIEEHILQRTGVRPETDLNDATRRASDDVSATDMAYLMANAQYSVGKIDASSPTGASSATCYANTWQSFLNNNGMQQQQQQPQQQQLINNTNSYPQWSTVEQSAPTSMFQQNVFSSMSNGQQNPMLLMQTQQISQQVSHDEGFGGSPINSGESSIGNWATLHAGWALAEQQPNSAATTIQSPMTDASTPIVPPSHLIMSSIWSDLNDPTD